MINKDYILRLAESFGRQLAIILRLRKANQFEDALIFIDDIFFNYFGITTGFVNSASEEMLLKLISRMGELDVEKCVIIAILLRDEGAVYEDMGRENESYYRYLKSLRLFLEVVLSGKSEHEQDIGDEIANLLHKLEDYELPMKTKNRLFLHYEKIGAYAQAENLLFDTLTEDETSDPEARQEMIEQGTAFYARLLAKNDEQLQSGNLARDSVTAGLSQLQALKSSGQSGMQ